MQWWATSVVHFRLSTCAVVNGFVSALIAIAVILIFIFGGKMVAEIKALRTIPAVHFIFIAHRHRDRGSLSSAPTAA